MDDDESGRVEEDNQDFIEGDIFNVAEFKWISKRFEREGIRFYTDVDMQQIRDFVPVAGFSFAGAITVFYHPDDKERYEAVRDDIFEGK